MYEQYMKVFHAIVAEIESSTGTKPEFYKPLEPNKLKGFFETLSRNTEGMDGVDFFAYMVSTLITNQALPNTNHRTTLAFAGTLLEQVGISVPTIRCSQDVEQYILDSKRIMEFGYINWTQNHIKRTRQLILKLVGNQSGKLGSITAYSIMNFANASSNVKHSSIAIDKVHGGINRLPDYKFEALRQIHIQALVYYEQELSVRPTDDDIYEFMAEELGTDEILDDYFDECDRRAKIGAPPALHIDTPESFRSRHAKRNFREEDNL